MIARNKYSAEEMQKIPKKKRFVRMDEGAKLYSMGQTSFREVAKEAKAVLHIKRITLVDMDRVDKYLESFYDEPFIE